MLLQMYDPGTGGGVPRTNGGGFGVGFGVGFGGAGVAAALGIEVIACAHPLENNCAPARRPGISCGCADRDL